MSAIAPGAALGERASAPTAPAGATLRAHRARQSDLRLAEASYPGYAFALKSLEKRMRSDPLRGVALRSVAIVSPGFAAEVLAANGLSELGRDYKYLSDQASALLEVARQHCSDRFSTTEELSSVELTAVDAYLDAANQLRGVRALVVGIGDAASVVSQAGR